MKKYILITGSCGLVGSESVIFFVKKGFKVIGVDNNMRQYFFGNDGSTLWVKNKLKKKYTNSYFHNSTDIRDFKSLEKIFIKFKKKIKLIIHAAAQPSHDWASKEIRTDFDINAIGTLNLLNLTKKYCDIKTPFIFLSTNKVYGDNPNKLKMKKKGDRFVLSKSENFRNGIDEAMTLDNCVHSFFGVSKLAADLMVQEFGKNFGMNTVCFRAGCITGPNHSGAKLHGFLSYLIKSCIKKQEYKIIGYNGLQVRDNIHSHDLVNCFWEFYKKPKRGKVYNIGGGFNNSCSILEVIKILEKKLQKKIKIKYQKKARTGDHKWWITSNKKFCSDYKKFKFKYNLEKTIKEIIKSIY